MNKSYSITTPKGEFALNRAEFTDIGISLCLPEFLKDLSEEELRDKFPASQQPAVIKSDVEYKAASI